MPLDKLRESTQQIAKGDFGSRVTVKSGDEFEDLATSFNSMTLQIDKQFKELATMANIDRAILSVLNVEKIVETFFSHIGDIFPCDSAGACLLNTNTMNTWHNYIRPSSYESSVGKEIINLCPEEIQTLYDNPKYLLMYLYKGLPRYLHYFIQQGMGSFLVMPIFLDERLSAIITLAHKKTYEYSQESLLHARQLSDRMTVALSNAHLIEELNQFNIGTLTALARVVDAKSPWTAGHSERVAEIGTRLGREIGLPQHELDILTKEGLLHDIGKISIPSEILNKPWKLTKEEFPIIQEHPLTGVRILKPIIPYAETIPIVLQHHERFDGKGYPNGIYGENIVLGARILALADTFDAITSDRPYRKKMKVEKAIEVIKSESGRQFDPKLVQAFLKIISEGNKEEEGKEGYK